MTDYACSSEDIVAFVTDDVSMVAGLRVACLGTAEAQT